MNTSSNISNTLFAVKFRNSGTLQYRTETVITITEEGKERKHYTERLIEAKYVNRKYALAEITTDIIDTRIAYDGILRKSEGLVKQLGEIYNNLSIYVNWQGSIHSILHTEKLRQRWKSIRAKVEKRYKGNEVDIYLESIEQRLQDKDKVLEEISAYRFLGLLFPGLCDRKAGQNIHREAEAAFLKGETMRITEEFHTENYDPEHQTVEWVLKGVQHKEDTQSWVLDHYQGHFILNAQSGWIEEVALQINIKDEKRAKQTLYTVKRIS